MNITGIIIAAIIVGATGIIIGVFAWRCQREI